MLDLKLIQVDVPENTNVIIGQSHFIKTTEDIHDALVGSVPGIQFGLAFCESSGPRLVRREGTSDELKELATKNALKIGAGHCFVLYLKGDLSHQCPKRFEKHQRDLPDLLRDGKSRAGDCRRIRARAGNSGHY